MFFSAYKWQHQLVAEPVMHHLSNSDACKSSFKLAVHKHTQQWHVCRMQTRGNPCFYMWNVYHATCRTIGDVVHVERIWRHVSTVCMFCSMLPACRMFINSHDLSHESWHNCNTREVKTALWPYDASATACVKWTHPPCRQVHVDVVHQDIVKT